MPGYLRKIIFLVFLSFSLSNLSHAQNWEIGFGIGGANYSGDLSPNNRFKSIENTYLSLSVFAKYNLSEYVGFRTGFIYTKLSEDDANSSADWQILRNLSFRSTIYELSEIIDINFLGEKRWTPYAMAGIAIFAYNPQTRFQGDWVDLRPLGTEGQGLPEFPDRQQYGRFSTAWILGGGLKYTLNESFSISVELATRITNTDYLDDVSKTYVDYNTLLNGNGILSASLGNRINEGLGINEPNNDFADRMRGNDDNNDYYFVGLVKLHYSINGTGLFGRGGSNINKCPSF